jgi:hypothetical protein
VELSAKPARWNLRRLKTEKTGGRKARPSNLRQEEKMKLCKTCKDAEATEGNQCFMCWEEGNYLVAEFMKEFNLN